MRAPVKSRVQSQAALTAGERLTNNQAGEVNKAPDRRDLRIFMMTEKGWHTVVMTLGRGVTVRTVMESLKGVCIKKYGRAGEVVES